MSGIEIPAEAVEVAMRAWRDRLGSNDYDVMMRAALVAAAPALLAAERKRIVEAIEACRDDMAAYDRRHPHPNTTHYLDGLSDALDIVRNA